MAHVQLLGNRARGRQLIVDGIDLSHMAFADGIELVEVGEGVAAQVGLRVIFAVSRLDLDTEVEVKVTNHFTEVAQQVRSLGEEDSA